MCYNNIRQALRNFYSLRKEKITLLFDVLMLFIFVDEVTWHLPSETIMVSDRLVLEVVSSSVLKAHLNCSYLHPQVMSSIEPVLLKRLGVKMLQTSELLDILSSVVLTSRQSG